MTSKQNDLIGLCKEFAENKLSLESEGSWEINSYLIFFEPGKDRKNINSKLAQFNLPHLPEPQGSAKKDHIFQVEEPINISKNTYTLHIFVKDPEYMGDAYRMKEYILDKFDISDNEEVNIDVFEDFNS